MIFKNYKIWIFGSIVFFIFINLSRLMNKKSFSTQYTYDVCMWSNKMRVQEMNGVVSSKYIDSKNHNKPTIEVKQGSRNEKFQFTNEKSGFYNFINVGDSILKESGELEVSVFTKVDTTATMLNYGCKN